MFTRTRFSGKSLLRPTSNEVASSPISGIRQALRAADRQDALVVVDVERRDVHAHAVLREIALEAHLERGRLLAVDRHELRDLERPRVERLRAIAGGRGA